MGDVALAQALLLLLAPEAGRHKVLHPLLYYPNTQECRIHASVDTKVLQNDHFSKKNIGEFTPYAVHPLRSRSRCLIGCL